MRLKGALMRSHMLYLFAPAIGSIIVVLAIVLVQQFSRTTNL